MRPNVDRFVVNPKPAIINSKYVWLDWLTYWRNLTEEGLNIVQLYIHTKKSINIFLRLEEVSFFSLSHLQDQTPFSFQLTTECPIWMGWIVKSYPYDLAHFSKLYLAENVKNKPNHRRDPLKKWNFFIPDIKIICTHTYIKMMGKMPGTKNKSIVTL